MALKGLAVFGVLGLTVIQTIGFSTPLLAQDALDCESTDPVDKLICATPMLKIDNDVMNSIWQTWQQGINGSRMEYLQGEQNDWLNARKECLSESEPATCLQTKYEDRIQVLTRERVFKSSEKIDDVDYRVMRAMTALSYDELAVEAALDQIAYLQADLDVAQTALLVPPEDNCADCSYERKEIIKTAFSDPALLILSVDASKVLDGGDPLEAHQIKIYDQAKQLNISLIDLFVPSTLPFAKSSIKNAIIGELDRLNKAVKGNENGETQYYWAETSDNFDAMGDEDWSGLGLYPVVEDGKIAAFEYQADSFEFAPYGSGEHFSGFVVPVDPLLAFIRPEYRASFK